MCSPTDILPPEIWEQVFRFVPDPINAALSCTTFACLVMRDVRYDVVQKAAIQHGCLPPLKWLIARYPFQDRDCLQNAAKLGHLDIVKWLIQCYQGHVDFLTFGVYHLPVLQWLIEQKYFNMLYLSSSYTAAAAHGCIDTLKWLDGRVSDRVKQKGLKSACIAGQLDTAQYILDRIPTPDTAFFQDLMEVNHLCILEWITATLQIDLSRNVWTYKYNPSTDVKKWHIQRLSLSEMEVTDLGWLSSRERKQDPAFLQWCTDYFSMPFTSILANTCHLYCICSTVPMFQWFLSRFQMTPFQVIEIISLSKLLNYLDMDVLVWLLHTFLIQKHHLKPLTDIWIKEMYWRKIQHVIITFQLTLDEAVHYFGMTNMIQNHAFIVWWTERYQSPVSILLQYPVFLHVCQMDLPFLQLVERYNLLSVIPTLKTNTRKLDIAIRTAWCTAIENDDMATLKWLVSKFPDFQPMDVKTHWTPVWPTPECCIWMKENAPTVWLQFRELWTRVLSSQPKHLYFVATHFNITKMEFLQKLKHFNYYDVLSSLLSQDWLRSYYDFTQTDLHAFFQTMLQYDWYDVIRWLIQHYDHSPQHSLSQQAYTEALRFKPDL